MNQKPDRYGISLGEKDSEGKYIWYNNFDQCPAKKGDKVKIEYTERGIFKNIQHIEVIKEEGEITIQTEAIDASAEMKACLKEAKDIAKEYYEKDFVNPDKIIDLGIALFKFKVWSKK